MGAHGGPWRPAGGASSGGWGAIGDPGDQQGAALGEGQHPGKGPGAAAALGPEPLVCWGSKVVPMRALAVLFSRDEKQLLIPASLATWCPCGVL